TLVFRCFFFFQAEDGIRDFHVTGVQTCALPIYTAIIELDALADTVRAAAKNHDLVAVRSIGLALFLIGRVHVGGIGGELGGASRSEERRVGKEWRCRGGEIHLTTKFT